MNSTIKLGLIIAFSSWSLSACQAQKESMTTITKNNMTVQWAYQNDRIYFEMSAPTDGWITVGFNTESRMTGAYLLMGHIVKGEANVVEYYTSSPGNYQPIQQFGAESQIKDVEGEEHQYQTVIRFSLPVKAMTVYQKDLFAGLSYRMILAYSQMDDFEHHSMMRTSVNVQF